MVEEILSRLNISEDVVILPAHGTYYQVTWGTLIEAMLPDNNSEAIAECIGRTYASTKGSLTTYLGRNFKDKPKTVKWAAYFLSKLDKSFCAYCGNIKSTSEFNKDNTRFLGITSKCSICCRNISNSSTREYYINNKSDFLYRNSLRRARKLQATPVWANLLLIREKYRTCPAGYHVDHVIPLVHPLVCGLHVHSNLQHLTAQENLIKGNSFQII